MDLNNDGDVEQAKLILQKPVKMIAPNRDMAWMIVIGLVVLALNVVILGIGVYRMDTAVKRIEDRQKRVLMDPRTSGEYAALSMLRVGLQDWNAACGRELGRRGVSRETAIKSCTIQLHIGGER